MGLQGLRTGTQYLKDSPRSGGGKWIPRISWKDKEAKTIQFLTPVENIAKIQVHEFVKVPDDSQKGWHYELLMCRKDPAWAEESGGLCVLCDVIGHKAKEKHAAIALELDVILEEGTKQIRELKPRIKEFTREDKTVVEYPQWGLVLQSFGNFFKYFSTQVERRGLDLTQVAWDVYRDGGDMKTSYVSERLDNPVPDISGLEVPTLFDILAKIGSEEYYAEKLDGVEPGSQENEFDDSDVTPEKRRTKFDELRERLPAGQIESYSAAN